MINIKTTTRLLSYQKKQLSWLFFMLYAFFCALNSSAEVFFSQDCKKNIIDLINNSEKEIHIAVYSIDDPDITESLFKFVEKGGKLQVITDRVQAAGRQSRSPDIYNKINPNFKINSKRFRIMHDKFAIFDLKKTVNGSFNWTYSAANKNAEDCKISNEEQDIERFYEKFKDMWDSFSNEETDYFFKKLALKKEIKLKLEKQEKEGSLYDELPSYKMNRFESNKLKFCIKLCRNKCTKQEIIRREVFQLEKNQKQQNLT
jgi:phosphatidylserine/phosphatidylglycerophosphate/cardiolipin synthase-like enzyme